MGRDGRKRLDTEGDGTHIENECRKRAWAFMKFCLSFSPVRLTANENPSRCYTATNRLFGKILSYALQLFIEWSDVVHNSESTESTCTRLRSHY